MKQIKQEKLVTKIDKISEVFYRLNGLPSLQ